MRLVSGGSAFFFDDEIERNERIDSGIHTETEVTVFVLHQSDITDLKDKSMAFERGFGWEEDLRKCVTFLKSVGGGSRTQHQLRKEAAKRMMFIDRVVLPNEAGLLLSGNIQKRNRKVRVRTRIYK